MSRPPMAWWSGRAARDAPCVSGSPGVFAGGVRRRAWSLPGHLSRVGRRPTPVRILDRARVLVTHQNDQQPLPLSILATMIGVHVRTLCNAARDGRLAVTYATRTTFRRLRGYATPADARAFRHLCRNPRGLARGSSLLEHGVPERTEERTADRRLTDHSLSHESAIAQLDVHNRAAPGPYPIGRTEAPSVQSAQSRTHPTRYPGSQRIAEPTENGFAASVSVPPNGR